MGKRFLIFVFAFIGMAIFLGGCSRIDLAANFAGTYIANQLDKYFDTNSIQSHFIKKAVKEDIKSIKRILFPKAADEFEKVLREAEELKNWNKDLIVAHEKSMKDIFYSALKILEHSAADFSVQLTDEQLKAFRKEFKKKTEDIEDLAQDPRKSRDKRYDKTRKFIEGWIGPLNIIQKKDLYSFCQLNLFPYREQIKNREKLVNGFVEAFPDLQKRQQYVSGLFLGYETLRDPDYTRAVLEDQDKFIELLVKMANSMDEDQRNHLRDTLKDRIKQLRDSAEGKKSQWF